MQIKDTSVGWQGVSGFGMACGGGGGGGDKVGAQLWTCRTRDSLTFKGDRNARLCIRP